MRAVKVRVLSCVLTDREGVTRNCNSLLFCQKTPKMGVKRAKSTYKLLTFYSPTTNPVFMRVGGLFSAPSQHPLFCLFLPLFLFGAISSHFVPTISSIIYLCIMLFQLPFRILTTWVSFSYSPFSFPRAMRDRKLYSQISQFIHRRSISTLALQ